MTERGVVSGEPTRFRLRPSTSGWQPVAAWAGPWPVDERWWSGGEGRASRFQVVGADGRAWLLVCGAGRLAGRGGLRLRLGLMGWNNPAILEGAGAPALRAARRRRRAGVAAQARPARASRGGSRSGRPVTPYAELHCHSHFSFLDGASRRRPSWCEEAVRLGLHGLAITDHDGFYGAPMLAEAAAAYPTPGCAPSTAPSCRWGSAGRRTACPTPRAATCWCWPAGSRATTGSPRR